MNPKQRREIKDWYTDLALGRTIKAEDIERPAAELARREQAQAAGNNALMTEAAQKIDELRAERDNARRVAVTMGNERSRLESILDDLQAECVRRSDTIHGLTADNARLRSLLDEAHTALSVEALANAHKQGMSYDDAVKKMCEIDLLKRIEEAV